MMETHAAKRQFDSLAEQQESTQVELTRLTDRQTECEQDIEARESEVAVQRAALKELLIAVALILVLRLKPSGVLPERIPPAPQAR